MTACTPANAMLALYEHASKTLPAARLEWLGNLYLQAEIEAKNLSSTLEALACSVDAFASVSDEGLQNIFFGLSNQAALISVMVSIASDAEETAQERLSGGGHEKQ